VSVPAFQYVPIPGRKAPGEEGLSLSSKTFKNWTTAPNGGQAYDPGDKIQLAADTVLYARWQDEEPGKRTFWAQDTGHNWYTVEAVKRADGTNCIIYADILATIPNETITDIKTKYDTDIHDTIINAFGNFKDMEQPGDEGHDKVTLLLLDIKDGYTGSGGYVAGYFDSTHMYNTATYPVSNVADMLFIDVNPGLDELPGLYSTIAHELQHLINFSRTVAINQPEKDLWINEGLSTAAEYIYNPGDTSRIEYFNGSNTPEGGYYGTIPAGNNFFVWDGFWERVYGDVLADYATAYLFFRWLGIHASSGTGIYKEIIDDPNGDYRAVTTAAESKIDAQFSNWEKLLGTWMTANYYNSPDGPDKLYGYKDQLTTVVLVLENTGHKDLWFSPGEGIFSKQTGSFSTGPNTGSHIRYRGLNKISATPPVESAPYTGTTLLTFNANPDFDPEAPDPGYADEIGYLAGMAGTRTGPALSALPAGLPVRAAGSVSADGTAYPVGFGDKAAGLDRPGKAAPRTRPGAR
jgi:hypothetical protein